MELFTGTIGGIIGTSGFAMMDIKSLIMGALGGKLAADNTPVVVVQPDKQLPEEIQ